MTPKRKLRVAVLFGGKSAEHEVSIQSARNVVEALDKDRFDPVLIGIDKRGKWHRMDQDLLNTSAQEGRLPPTESEANLNLVLGAAGNQIVASGSGAGIGSFDVVFPVLHGPYGEDGSLQGLLKLANMAFVGPGVLSSAVGMDKDVMKRLLRDAGIPIADFLVFKSNQRKDIGFEAIAKRLGLPFFVKPANLGSSIGISKVKTAGELAWAIEVAFSYDRKLLVERNISGREVECAVLGNDDPIASIPGELVGNNREHEFYTYEAKYLDPQGTTARIPAELAPEKAEEIRQLAVETYRVLGCEGMARVDFFLEPSGRILVNEVNTIPGFTSVSMYPKLWEASGLGYKDLLTKLIELAISRFEEEQRLKTSVEPEIPPP